MKFKATLLFTAAACFRLISAFRSVNIPINRAKILAPEFGRRYLSVPTNLKMAGSEETAATEDEKALTPEVVAEMVEVSFVNGVMQLSQGYVDVLKLFIAAVISGYSLDISPQDLMEKVAACPHQSANRPLMEEEIQLRTSWIQVIYLVLSHVDYQEKAKTLEDLDLEDSIRKQYEDAIPILVKAKDKEEAFETVLQKCNGVLPATDNPLEQAVISQSLRVMFITLTVLEEEQICIDDKKPQKPQPPIPGAFK